MKIFFGFFNPFFLCVLDKGYNSQQGLEQGAQKKAEEAAIILLKMDKLSQKEIAQAQGLTLEQVLELQKKVPLKA